MSLQQNVRFCNNKLAGKMWLRSFKAVVQHVKGHRCKLLTSTTILRGRYAHMIQTRFQKVKIELRDIRRVSSPRSGMPTVPFFTG